MYSAERSIGASCQQQLAAKRSPSSPLRKPPLSPQDISPLYILLFFFFFTSSVRSSGLLRAAMGERRLPAGACLLAVAMVLQAAAVVLVLGEESDGAGALLDPRQLEKFVDELPDMPRLRGYGVTEGGSIVAGNLTIGE